MSRESSKAEQIGNVYEDAERANAYATLGFPGTYYLAFRDLPAIISQHVTGCAALDFGCGTGRSSRFLTSLGFSVTGVDIAANMVALAIQADPDGDYRVVPDGDFRSLADRRYDLILAAFPFDNIAGEAHRAILMRGLRELLSATGRILVLASTPEIYTHEWASFATAQFPENRNATSGTPVRIITKDHPDPRPVIDILWTHDDYLALFGAAGLSLIREHRPLGLAGERPDWVTETRLAPWIIYVIGRQHEHDPNRS